jgi:hypothetical protein
MSGLGSYEQVVMWAGKKKNIYNILRDACGGGGWCFGAQWEVDMYGVMHVKKQAVQSE